MTASTQVTGGLTALSLWSDSQLQEAIMKDPTVYGGVDNDLHTSNAETIPHTVAKHCHTVATGLVQANE